MSKVTPLRIVLSLAAPRPSLRRPTSFAQRLYSTPRSSAAAHAQSQATADLLNKGSTAGAGAGEQDHAGPFPLGVGAGGGSKPWRTWRELGLGGKLVRTVRQSGNLAVIIAGGTLFVVLTLALTTELFARNSPSVLYAAAVDMIRASDGLDQYLLPPIKFTHSPHSSSPVRGTPSISSTTVRNLSSGKEHLIISFWVHGRGKDEELSLGWLRRAWVSTKAYAKESVEALGLVGQEPEGLAKEAFKEDLIEEGRRLEAAGQKKSGRWFSWLGGLNLRAAASSVRITGREPDPAGTYTTGEARGEYVKDENGHYQLLSLIVDVPSSRAAYPGRAVIHQTPEAEVEGLLGKRIR
ncbi:hypothetical protein L198_04014 [Cryptococcus wingfieldii CBS 7118]|uniref:Mitochondrial import inner membrane translocase subunit Tim21 n=1 Tax=Cryptococcus wingfieldii CBS 7118 TaxID=1295528 RepID=A0A1E3J9B4_9TREE|nr:hypothetical protein L198_04014 [Cryptococcus wingfieldii CBS 7118]ODN97450.1 hypothetical protein L198_04014 [Cryptococcus wingfieldii CBS 7118]